MLEWIMLSHPEPSRARWRATLCSLVCQRRRRTKSRLEKGTSFFMNQLYNLRWGMWFPQSTAVRLRWAIPPEAFLLYLFTFLSLLFLLFACLGIYLWSVDMLSSLGRAQNVESAIACVMFALDPLNPVTCTRRVLSNILDPTTVVKALKYGRNMVRSPG